MYFDNVCECACRSAQDLEGITCRQVHKKLYVREGEETIKFITAQAECQSCSHKHSNQVCVSRLPQVSFCLVKKNQMMRYYYDFF